MSPSRSVDPADCASDPSSTPERDSGCLLRGHTFEARPEPAHCTSSLNAREDESSGARGLRAPAAKSLSLTIFTVIASLLGTAATGATFTATSTLDQGDADTSDLVCDADPGRLVLCTLRAAIQQANVVPGVDFVVLSAAEYTLDLLGGGEDFAASGDLDILDDLEIVGAGVDQTFIDGNLTDRVLYVAEGVEATVRHLTIHRGHVSSFGGLAGGGVLNDGILHLFDVALRDNDASAGGGLFNDLQAVIDGATAGSAEAHLVRVTVDNNLASAVSGGGGGIFNAGVLEVEESTISRNSVPPEESPLVLISPPDPLDFDGYGGGIYNSASGNAVLVNTTVSSNTTGNGGGIANSGNLFVSASTLAFNVGEVEGAQLFNEDWAVFKGTILGGPLSSAACGGTAPVESLGDNLEHSDTCGLDPLIDLVGTNPLLLPLGGWGGPTETHAITSSSPAVDAMLDCRRLPLAPLSGDQRGAPRTMDGDGDGAGGCDIGSYEVLPAGLLFYDRFESGDTSAWTAVVP